ncbi:caspase family protein [Vibrio amylolyticus]|uniref:caspase family protein n=1 Tax=Vibrio amylolyticus TaxID=2847292 RepID=UPI00354FFD24
MLNRSLVSLTLALATLFSLPTAAGNRALLVGVGEHQDPNNYLPGIDLDVQNMHQTVRLLGYQEDEIKILMDSQSTEENIKYQIENWLGQAGETDQALFYFSGHGTNVPDFSGDENDQQDEVLVAYDSHVVFENDQYTLDGVLLDDEFNRLLSNLKAKQTYVFVDACSSGTSTKSFDLGRYNLGETQGITKFLNYQGALTSEKVSEKSLDNMASKSSDIIEANDQSFLTLAAARDDEYAIATNRGSIFTLGLNSAINSAIAQDQDLSAIELHAQVTQYVADKTDASNRFHPVISGDITLLNQKMGVQTVESEGAVWLALSDLVEESEPLNISSNAKEYNLHDKVTYQVDVDKPGYLNVINIDANDQAVVIFPNKFNPDNQVKSGELLLPTKDMNFDFQAQPPYGKSMTIAVISSKPLNLYEQTTEGRDENGEIIASLVSLSGSGLRAIGAVARDEPIYVGKVETLLKE